MPTTTPKGKTALEQKRKDRADLKQTDIIWIGIAATEQNIQRFAAFLMFADYHKEVKPLGPLPYEEEMPFDAEPAPALEIDFESVKRAIITALKAWVDAVGPEVKTRFLELCKQYGGERLSTVPQANLIELLAALQKETQ